MCSITIIQVAKDITVQFTTSISDTGCITIFIWYAHILHSHLAVYGTTISCCMDTTQSAVPFYCYKLF